MDYRKILLHSGVMLTGLALMEGMKHGYRTVKNEDPPLNTHSTNFSLPKVLLWTALTSVVIGGGKLLAREFLDRQIQGKQLKEKGGT